MKNSYLRDQIKWSLRRVPKENGSLKYIPLHQLPEGTKILVETGTFLEEKEERMINGRREIDVQRLKSGVYELQMGVWPTMSLTPFEGDTVPLKLLYPFLTPGSTLQGNIDLPVSPRGHNDPWSITYRVASGPISKVSITDTEIILENNQLIERVHYGIQ